MVARIVSSLGRLSASTTMSLPVGLKRTTTVGLWAVGEVFWYLGSMEERSEAKDGRSIVE